MDFSAPVRLVVQPQKWQPGLVPERGCPASLWNRIIGLGARRHAKRPTAPWSDMTKQPVCPYCGLPMPAAEQPDIADQAAVIESMNREIRQLRETVARLRGSRAGLPLPRQDDRHV